MFMPEIANRGEGLAGTV